MFLLKKKLFSNAFLVCIILILLISCDKDDTGDVHRLVFNHNGADRSYILYKPHNLPLNAPLVFVLHGYTSNSEFANFSYGMNSVADTHSFAVCYPQGSKDNYNNSHWNANLNVSTTDDIDFLCRLAANLQTQHLLDSQRTFACGMSNGGFMSYTLACEAPHVFSAVASVTGTMSAYDWNNCNASYPVPVLHIHGVDDNIVPIDGSLDTTSMWGGAPEVSDVVDYWATKNTCSTVDTLFIPQRTTAFYHRNGINNSQVWFYRLNNWGHAWPLPSLGASYNASSVIWSFFSMY
ncbi:alpha/beta hydrolase-fold protein [Aureispira]|nr:alpha/beta hydrolase-fold protein [Aureispira sp.]